MRSVIMAIGIPGAGKTTLHKQYSAENNWIYIAPDEIRTEIIGDEKDLSNEDLVWEVTYLRVQEALKTGKTVAVDATFSDTVYRLQFLEMIRKHGAEKVEGVYITTSLETAKVRNAGRDRIVPDHVLERKHQELQVAPPMLKEGFDTIYTLDEHGHLHEILPDEAGNEIKRSLGKLR